jgi:hypothetical protein
MKTTHMAQNSLGECTCIGNFVLFKKKLRPSFRQEKEKALNNQSERANGITEYLKREMYVNRGCTNLPDIKKGTKGNDYRQKLSVESYPS